MPIVNQAITCPVCGAGRKLREIGLDDQGGFDPQNTPSYALLVKLNELGGRGHSVWTRHEIPTPVLQALRERIVHVLAQVDSQLADRGF